ncbi:MlaD family protein [Adhaeribacter aquaticus]|uniref:MlaD family protein n=1 Tax=Adhaeribacter aquaticus TaxID=299567 RepID=UPI0006846E2B|nr:MlaD family protein [Adhaeribacter aquaticus]
MRISKEVKVALLGVVALGSLYFGYLFLKGTDFFTSTRKFYVIYENVDGLTVSSPVILNGVHVGLVENMQIMPEPKHRIKVALNINKEIPIGDSTIATLASSDLLGGKAITLYVRPNSKEYQGGETLISYVQQSLTDMLTAKAMPVLGKVDSTLLKLNAFFNEDAKKSIRATILNTQATTEMVRSMLLSNQRNINAITSNMAELSAALNVTEHKFDKLATNLTQITDSLKTTPINATVRELNATVLEAQNAINKFNQNNGTVGKLMNDDSLYANMNASTESLNALLKDFKANPKRYVHFSLIGGGTKVNKAENVKTATKVKNANTVENTGVVNEVDK